MYKDFLYELLEQIKLEYLWKTSISVKNFSTTNVLTSKTIGMKYENNYKSGGEIMQRSNIY